jgi:hypothetical protein
MRGSPCHSQPGYSIDATKRPILSILTPRNVLTLISILRAEILTHIFHFTVFSERPYSLGWFRVTYICRRRRQIALDDSTVWTHFSAYCGERTKSLSGYAMQGMCCSSSRLAGRCVKTLSCPQHISHTRELYLRNMSRNLCPIIGCLLSHFGSFAAILDVTRP